MIFQTVRTEVLILFLCGSILFVSSPARAQDAPAENSAPDDASDLGNGTFPSGGFSFDSVLSGVSYIDIMNAFARGEVDADGLRMFLGMKASALYGNLNKYGGESPVPPPAPAPPPAETAAPADTPAPAEQDPPSSVNPMSIALELLNAYLAGEIDPESLYEALLRFGFGMGCPESRAADCLERLFGKEDKEKKDKDKAEKDKAEQQGKPDKSKEESQPQPLKFEGLLGHWFEGSRGNGSSPLGGLRSNAPTSHGPSTNESCK